MEWLHALALALLQGLTEFLPISSSAHLILLPRLFGWSDQGLAFDVAVHLGSLLAVMWYFRAELGRLIHGWLRQVLRSEPSRDAALAWTVVVGTLPILVAGYLLNGAQDVLRSPLIIAAATMVFGIVLWIADRLSPHARDEHTLRWRDGLLIGAAQVLALIPGTSRSGVTMTAALLLGLERNAAARFSFLLSIPVILAAALLKLWDLMHTDAPVYWSAMLIGLAVSAVTAYLSIHFFLMLVQRIGMGPFVVYRLALGAVLLWLFV